MGSSASFSTPAAEKRLDRGFDGGDTCIVGRLGADGPGVESAAKGLRRPGLGALIDAWAVLAETDEVGCPEVKIDLFGFGNTLLC